MNNVQAGQQFNALQKATATYINDAKMADHLRRRETDLMNRAAEQIRLDDEEFRIVHGVVGEEERKRKNLEAEIKRYRDGIEADKKESIAVVSETTGKEANHKEKTMQWIKAMEVINDENDFILTKAENTKTSKYLNVENVEHIVETKLTNFATMNNNDNGDAQTAAEWNEIATLVKDETAGLAKAEENGIVQAKEMKELEQLIHQLRAKFLSENNNLGEMEVDDLEAKWEQQYEYNNNDVEKENVDHGDGSNMMEEVKGDKVMNTSAAAPVHMELFYNGSSQDYNGSAAVHDSSSANNVGYAC